AVVEDRHAPRDVELVDPRRPVGEVDLDRLEVEPLLREHDPHPRAVRTPRRVDQPHARGRLSLPPGGAGLRERLAPLPPPGSPGPCRALCPPTVRRQRRPTNLRNLTARAPSRPARATHGRGRAPNR